MWLILFLIRKNMTQCSFHCKVFFELADTQKEWKSLHLFQNDRFFPLQIEIVEHRIWDTKSSRNT